MTDAEALDLIKLLVSRGSVRFSRTHSYLRMEQRGGLLGITEADVLAALSSATSARCQPNGNYRVEGGKDRDRDDLTVIVAIEADVIVITVF